MASDAGFTNVAVSLRAPRIAVAIPNDQHWVYFARRAFEFLNRTWGGARGTVLPIGESGPHPAVLRLIECYDPDYLVPLLASLTDFESTQPGVRGLIFEGQPVPAGDRWDFIRRLEENGPHLQALLPSEAVDRVRSSLNTFTEEEGQPRIYAGHPLQTPDSLVALTADSVIGAVNVESGDALVDLSAGIHLGVSGAPTSTKRLQPDDLSHYDFTSFLVPEKRALRGVQLPKPNDATAVGLSEITMGLRLDRGVLVVLGRTVDDFALALTWNSFAGTAAWLPFTRSHRTWLRYAGTALDLARVTSDAVLRVTSASLSEDRCHELMDALWARRLVYAPDDPPRPWTYIDPQTLDPTARTDLRLDERWDQRYALPTSRDGGGRSMVTRFPLMTPLEGNVGRHWVVDVVADRAPIHSFAGFHADRLLAAEQDRWETFVRASETGISFESGRFDFVAAGASPYGQLAQPQLRWPSLPAMLDDAAARTGNHIRTSAPGHLGRLAADLFGGRDALSANLHGAPRSLLDQFVAPPKKNGPLAAGGIGLRGSNFFTFAHLANRVPAMTEPEIREWLDDHLKLGSIRAGHLLNCEVCQWSDYYALEDVGATYVCKRCASVNHLSLARWKMPIGGAEWFYDLHPTVTAFLRDHGDVPLLAVQALTLSGMRPIAAEFEFELTDSCGTPIVEIDFAFMSRGKLVIGEAKSNDTLDGKNKVARIRDARKLITAGEHLGAAEVCFASSMTWTQASKDAIIEAASEASTLIAVSIAQNVATPTSAARTVLWNAITV